MLLSVAYLIPIFGVTLIHAYKPTVNTCTTLWQKDCENLGTELLSGISVFIGQNADTSLEDVLTCISKSSATDCEATGSLCQWKVGNLTGMNIDPAFNSFLSSACWHKSLADFATTAPILFDGTMLEQNASNVLSANMNNTLKCAQHFKNETDCKNGEDTIKCGACVLPTEYKWPNGSVLCVAEEVLNIKTLGENQNMTICEMVTQGVSQLSTSSPTIGDEVPSENSTSTTSTTATSDFNQHSMIAYTVVLTVSVLFGYNFIF